MQILSLTLSALLIGTMGVFAQNSGHARVASYATPLRVTGSANRVDESNYLKPEFINNINVSAVRDFLKRFHEQPSARWYKLQDASLMVKFEAPDINYRIAYTNRGSWVYTIQTYYEKKMSKDVRHLVKSTYYDYSITQIEEINHVDVPNTVYIVHLKDDKSWKTLRVCDGEMEELETLYKK